MRRAIVAQCLGVHVERAFENGILLLYFLSMGMSDARIVLYLALLPIGHACCQLPFAYLADRLGKKRLGMVGLTLQPLGLVMLLAAGWLDGAARETLVVLAVLLIAAGMGSFTAGWFALLSAIVPASMRGRFFGRLRFSWMATAILFTGAATAILATDSPLWQFQIVLGLIVVGAVGRIFAYAPMTELERPQPEGDGFKETILKIVRHSQFISFIAYTFLLFLFAGGGPALFGLIEKQVLGMTESMVVALGAAMMVGSLVGFALSGGVIDRVGTRLVFVVCHLGFALAMSLLLFRGLLPVPIVWIALLANVAYGFCVAASSVALSTEVLALIPQENKSLSTSLWWTFERAGRALAGGVTSAALSLGILADSWTWLGQSRTEYDALLLGFSSLVALMVVTLGLVPSVVGQSGWVPR